jgi:hypothetical protein
MTMEIRKAVRSSAPPLIGLLGESGSGKTYSALSLAKGIAGPNGRRLLIDTENGRGELFADDPTIGGYDVLPLEPPFTSRRYFEAHQAGEKAGYDVIVIDSMSHEWEGLGGVLDQAGENEERTGKRGLHCWNEPKREHNRMVLAMMRSRALTIVCLRGKYKSRQVGTGKNAQVVKDDALTAIQSEGFIFELTCSFALDREHKLSTVKAGTPALRACFPADGTRPLRAEDGVALAKWIREGTAAPKPAAAPAAPDQTDADKLMVALDYTSRQLKALAERDMDAAMDITESVFGAANPGAVAACTDIDKLREAAKRYGAALKVAA